MIDTPIPLFSIYPVWISTIEGDLFPYAYDTYMLLFYLQMSGIEIDSALIADYNEFKKEKSSIAFLIFKIEDKKSVVVDQRVMKSEVAELLEKESSGGFTKAPLESDKYAVLRSILSKSAPRYAVVPVEYSTDTSQSKVALITWCSDNANVTERMLISSTKNTLEKKLEGVNSYQANDEQQLEYREVCDGISRGKAKWN